MDLSRSKFRPFAVVAVAAVVVVGLTGCAGGPTSSPEGTALAFLEAMKQNSPSAAMALVNGAGEAHVSDSEATFILPDSEHAVSPTGVTGFEIIDQSTRTSSSGDTVSITAQLVGGSIPDITFTISQGGPTGAEWLIDRMDPGFQRVTLNVLDLSNGTVTLAGGTEVPPSAEQIVLLPGAELTGALWDDFEGYYEQVELVVEGSSSPSLRWSSATPTQKAFDAARAFFEETREREFARGITPVLASPERFRVVSEPTFGEWQLEQDFHTVKGTMQVDLGVIEVCLIVPGWGTTTWEMASWNFEGGPDLPDFSNPSYSLIFDPYDAEVTQPPGAQLFGGTVDQPGKRVVELADCA